MKEFSHYIVLAEKENPNVDKFLDIYRKDKYKARVILYNGSINPFELIKKKVVVFFSTNGDFEIAWYFKKWGISKNNIIYNREKKIFSIYKTSNGFFCKSNGKIKPLTLNDIYSQDNNKNVINFLIKIFPPLEIMVKHELLLNKSFNYISKHKLTSLKKMLQFTYKVTYPLAKKIHENITYRHTFRKISNEYADYVTNIHKFNFDFFEIDNTNILYDSLSMAKTLNNKINLSWSVKRLKKEHDKMSKIITDITYSELNMPLNNHIIYKKFAEFSGYKLLDSSKELVYEGMKRKHCVGTYVNRVNSHLSGIYSINEYTLELNKVYDDETSRYIIKLNQFRGFNNKLAPEKLIIEVEDKINEFNRMIKENDTLITSNDVFLENIF